MTGQSKKSTLSAHEPHSCGSANAWICRVQVLITSVQLQRGATRSFASRAWASYRPSVNTVLLQSGALQGGCSRHSTTDMYFAARVCCPVRKPSGCSANVHFKPICMDSENLAAASDAESYRSRRKYELWSPILGAWPCSRCRFWIWLWSLLRLLLWCTSIKTGSLTACLPTERKKHSLQTSQAHAALQTQGLIAPQAQTSTGNPTRPTMSRHHEQRSASLPAKHATNALIACGTALTIAGLMKT